MKNKNIDQIFKAKRLRRRELKQLSFEEKIEIVARLQRIAREIKKDSKRKVWKIKA